MLGKGKWEGGVYSRRGEEKGASCLKGREGMCNMGVCLWWRKGMEGR